MRYFVLSSPNLKESRLFLFWQMSIYTWVTESQNTFFPYFFCLKRKRIPAWDVKYQLLKVERRVCVNNQLYSEKSPWFGALQKLTYGTWKLSVSLSQIPSLLPLIFWWIRVAVCKYWPSREGRCNCRLIPPICAQRAPGLLQHDTHHPSSPVWSDFFTGLSFQGGSSLYLRTPRT